MHTTVISNLKIFIIFIRQWIQTLIFIFYLGCLRLHWTDNSTWFFRHIYSQLAWTKVQVTNSSVRALAALDKAGFLWKSGNYSLLPSQSSEQRTGDKWDPFTRNMFNYIFKYHQHYVKLLQMVLTTFYQNTHYKK